MSCNSLSDPLQHLIGIHRAVHEVSQHPVSNKVKGWHHHNGDYFHVIEQYQLGAGTARVKCPTEGCQVDNQTSERMPGETNAK
jgi:hypothetical protein